MTRDPFGDATRGLEARRYSVGTSWGLAEEREQARKEFAAASSEAEVFLSLEAADASPLRSQALREAAVERLASERVERTTEYFLEQFTGLVEPNPRAMKRLLNAYAVHRDLAILSGLNVLVDVARREQLALWTILSLRWPSFRDYLLDRVQGRDVEADDGIRALAASDDVRRVLDGDGVDGRLDLDAIAALLGLGGDGSPQAGAVA